MARKDILELCRHTPRNGSTIDLDTTFPWEALCEEVSTLKVQRRSDHGDVVPLRAVAGDAADVAPTENQALASAVSYRRTQVAGLNVKKGGGAGSRIPPSDVGFDRSRPVSDGSPVAEREEVASASSVSIGIDASSGRKVGSSRDPICEQLALALERWTAE